MANVDVEATAWVRRFRLLLKHDGQVRRLAGFSAGPDGSLYIFPQSPTGRYFCGNESMGEGVVSHTFRFDSAPPIEEVPKLSLHPSGQVHLKKGAEYLTDPLRIPRFRDLRGEHVASVGASRFDILPTFQGKARISGSRRDEVIPVRKGVNAGRFAVYLNGAEASFAGKISVLWPLRGGAFVGVGGWADDDLGEDATFAIGGWDPTQRPWDHQEFLFVRGD